MRLCCHTTQTVAGDVVRVVSLVTTAAAWLPLYPLRVFVTFPAATFRSKHEGLRRFWVDGQCQHRLNFFGFLDQDFNGRRLGHNVRFTAYRLYRLRRLP